MAMNTENLKRHLCQQLCDEVRLFERNDGILMLDSPFQFPDGDHFPIYIDEAHGGGLVLTDRGHTMMHISYEFDVDGFYDGPRATLREQITRDYGIQKSKGVFSVETSSDSVPDAVFRLCQALSKIYDLTFMTRTRAASNFYDALKSLLYEIIGEEIVEIDYTPIGIPSSDAYSVDYKFEGKENKEIFVYGVPNRDKARLTTIMLSYFILNELNFESRIVYEDQQDIPRFDLARLTNVSGTAVSSLDARGDLTRKIEQFRVVA